MLLSWTDVTLSMRKSNTRPIQANKRYSKVQVFIGIIIIKSKFFMHYGRKEIHFPRNKLLLLFILINPVFNGKSLHIHRSKRFKIFVCTGSCWQTCYTSLYKTGKQPDKTTTVTTESTTTVTTESFERTDWNTENWRLSDKKWCQLQICSHKKYLKKVRVFGCW